MRIGSLAFYIYLTILGVSFFVFLNRKTLLVSKIYNKICLVLYLELECLCFW